MRFSSLRLSGFKSFVEATELEILDGLTGVVGPNGCGKSNLLEALRWAMGESSARSLRVGQGGGMDDVMFAGTARRPARNLAEVRLRLDNRQRKAPVEFNDTDLIEVGRAIRRGEGSRYFINGRDVRLRDVQLLFADAATGAHSPALVSQGRVGALISQRPQERRQLLEDAAGIAGLNVRRREAEIRLRAADANLVRLDDVLRSSENRAASLRRQARAAEEYRALSAQLAKLEAMVLRARWLEEVAQAQAAERALVSCVEKLEAADQKAASVALSRTEAASQLPGLRKLEDEAGVEVQQLSTKRATIVAEQGSAIQRLRDLETMLETSRADIARERARLSDSQATQARLQHEHGIQKKQLTEAEDAIVPLQEKAERSASELSDTERRLATALEAHAVLVADARAARAQAEATTQRLAKIEEEVGRVEGERSRLQGKADVSEIAPEIARLEAQLAGSEAEIERAANQIQQAEQGFQSARAVADSVEQELLAVRTKVMSLEAEAEALARLQKPSAKQDAGKKTTGVTTGVYGLIHAAPGYETALAAALGEDAAAPLQEDASGNSRYWAALPADGHATHTAVVGAQPLLPHVDVPPALLRRLGQVAVVDTPPASAEMAALLPGQALVSRDGWLWRWDGLVAPPGGQINVIATSLTQENRRRAIREALVEPKAQLESLTTELARQREVLKDMQTAERAARDQRTVAERQRGQWTARLDGLKSVAARQAARLDALSASLERLAVEAANAQEEAEEAQARLAVLPDGNEAASEVGAARTLVERARAELAEARAEAAAVVRQKAEAGKRIARLTQELQEWQARDLDAQKMQEELAQRISALDEDRARLVGMPDALDARIVLLDQELAQARQAKSDMADKVATAELVLARLDEEVREAGAEVSNHREERARLSTVAEQRRAQLADTIAESRERFESAPKELPASPAQASKAELAAEMARTLKKREGLGIVNLRADIELAEIEEVLNAQKAERADIETAIHRLRGSIGTLNKEGRARLMEAFRAIDQHFRELFITLFGGGVAELALVEHEDILEAGLEIRAQPPGKKLQSMSLLSGGEQALTAIALIFALFRTNPAPICVLDEVDAPLDDANVERFTRLLHHMANSTDTRFLVVTHNPVTMAAMHRLYGVTMTEAGVSQLVSVELPEAEALVMV